MSSPFGIDPYPGRPKILFIGIAASSHTRSWIDLLGSTQFNIRLFDMPAGYPPDDWPVRTYIIAENPRPGLDPNTRNCFYPTPDDQQSYLNRVDQWVAQNRKKPAYWMSRVFRKAMNIVRFSMNRPLLMAPVLPLPVPRSVSPRKWLAEIIQEWQPDIIHTAGLDPAGFYYFQTREEFSLAGTGKWILQLRGGSDLTLSRLQPDSQKRISAVMNAADQIISDNRINIRYASEMGIDESRFASVCPVPGTGGIDVDSQVSTAREKPSLRRLILWPKAYESTWSKALPVFEALKLCWKSIQPCTIHLLSMTDPDTRAWFYTLPEQIRENCIVHDRIPRSEVLSLTGQARVMLIPSLVDGVPNTLYEAMASGAFPIVSPLDTIRPVVENEKNVLFARNLYPEEIEAALTRAMCDDQLVDEAGQNNLELVRKIADRSKIKPRMIAFYEDLAGESNRNTLPDNLGD